MRNRFLWARCLRIVLCVPGALAAPFDTNAGRRATGFDGLPTERPRDLRPLGFFFGPDTRRVEGALDPIELKADRSFWFLIQASCLSGASAWHSCEGAESISAHRFLHERADPCLFGSGQLPHGEGRRPHVAFVEVRLVAEAERRAPRVEPLRDLEEADDLVVLGIRGPTVPGFRREERRAQGTKGECFGSSEKRSWDRTFV